MNRIEQQLDGFKRTLDRRIEQVSQKVTRLTMLTLISVLMLLGLAMVLGNWRIAKLDSRLDEVGITVSVPVTQTQQLQPVSSEAIAGINARLASLENLQEAIVSASKGALEQMNFVFAIVAAFFGLFSLFFAYRQIMADTSREGHDEEMRNLVHSFQDNINTISSLIITLEKSFEYRGEVQEQLAEIGRRAALLESYKEESDIVFRNLIAELNAEAVRLFSAEIDRASLSREENRSRLESFANRMNNAETMRQVEGLLNPFCYFLRGLSSVAVYQYESAVNDFQIAHKKGRVDLVDPKLSNYAEHDRENIERFVRDMLVACGHFQGVSFKNLGNYAESRRKFQEALDREPTYLQARTYMLQVMFFDRTVDFETIEGEYDRASEEFERALKQASDAGERSKLKKSLNVLKINQGNMYLKKWIHFDFRSGYRQHENQDKALKYYWEAYDYLNNDLAAFSVAQAMEGVGPSAWRGRAPQDLYEEAVSSLKKRVTEDHDHLYSVMLYYMLAICARKLRDVSESSEVFLSQARHSLRQVPSHVTCFSPINKIRLTRTEILEEMEKFEGLF
jgi:tetratricopeptide (TPR) repeat protein